MKKNSVLLSSSVPEKKNLQQKKKETKFIITQIQI